MDKRFQESQRVAVVGIVGNLMLSIIKIIAGVTYKSQALIADGANSVGDVINSLITFLANKISSHPKDSEHQYGHGKAEAIATQTIGIILCFIAFEVFTNALSILKSRKTSMNFSYIMIIVPIIVILTKIFMYKYAIKIGKKYSNLLVLANATDHKTDIFVTLGTIIGIIFTQIGIWWMDPIVGMIISLWILIQGLGISKSAINILMDSSIDTKILDMIKNTISTVEGVKEVQRVTTHTLGIGYSVEVRIGIDCMLPIVKGHSIASHVKEKLLNTAEITDVIVHINPVSQYDCDHECLKDNINPVCRAISNNSLK